MRPLAFALVLWTTSLSLGGVAHADADPLRHETTADIAITSAAGAFWLSSELLKASVVPAHCRWCYRSPDGEDLLNPIDAKIRLELRWRHPRTAETVSSVLAFVIEPVTMLGLGAGAAALDHGISGFPLDVLLVSEATLLAADVNQIAKYIFARERPFAHFLPRAPDGVVELGASPSDDNLSFFSGHTTLAFALATSVATVGTLRGYKLAPALWATGMPLAMLIGYLRIGADEHYFSDVMTAAVVGSLFGVGVPLLFHRPSSSSSSTAATPAALSFGGAF